MANTKTWSERVLNAASKETFINTSVLRKRLRIPGTEVDNISFNNSIMRTVRKMKSEGLLKRIDRGVYRISKAGKKQLVG